MKVVIEETKFTVTPTEETVKLYLVEENTSVEVVDGIYHADANFIQGVPVASGGIEDGQVLVYSEEAGQYQPKCIDFTEADYEAGETLGGHRIVEINNGKAYYADNSDVIFGRKLGMTKNAAALGSLVRILFFGNTSEASWDFDLSKSIFLGENGLITQVKPESGYMVIVGKPVTNNRLFININDNEIIKLGGN